MRGLILILSVLLIGCNNDQRPKPDIEEKRISEVDTVSIHNNYEIINGDINDHNISLDIYTTNEKRITDLNNTLVNQYNPRRDKFMMVMYFDDKKVGAVWRKKSADMSVPDSEWKKMDPHRLALYSFNPSNKFERLSFDKITE